MADRGLERTGERRKHARRSEVFASFLPVALEGQSHPVLEQVWYQRAFYEKRQTLLQNNKSLPKIAGLLKTEVLELNGHTEEGMSLEDYRAQELVDVLLYALECMIHAHHVPHLERIDQLIAESGVPLVEKSSLIPTAGYPANYERIKNRLNAAAEALFVDEAQTQVLPRREFVFIVEQMWADAAAALSTLNRNVMEEVREKIGRNWLKFPLSPLAEDTSPEGYRQYITWCKERWNKEGLRPNGGNKAFFDRSETDYSDLDLSRFHPLSLETALQDIGLTWQAYQALALKPESIQHHREVGLPFGTGTAQSLALPAPAERQSRLVQKTRRAAQQRFLPVQGASWR